MLAANGGVTGALGIPVAAKGTCLVDIQSKGASHREMELVD
ncbi:MAG TPA: hypothetical protein PKO15_15495 [Fibrobacteria bacterium]|nr:hypothetical protein [Fibrobacteria bacterium]